MSVRFFEPLQRSWNRAARMLFRPFRFEFWLVLGFAAFLANLGNSGGTGGWNWGNRFRGDDGAALVRTLHDLLHTTWVLWTIVISFMFLMALGVVFAWLSARGKLVFLDNVLHERAAIVEPWNRHARLGNSLFVFLLLVGLGALAFFVVLFGPPLYSLLRHIWRDGDLETFSWFGLAIRGIIAVPLVFAFGVFNVLTRHFVVPLMWKYGLTPGSAWARFWPLLTHQPGEFFVYLLLLLGLYVALAIAIVITGFCTCCIGFLLVGLPYVGSVTLLPVHVTFRGFGVEFLAQFGPEWDVRPPAAPVIPRPPPPPPLPPPPPPFEPLTP